MSHSRGDSPQRARSQPGRGRLAIHVFLLSACATLSWAQAKAGPEFRVNAHTTSNQEEPSLAVDANGHFVLVWASDGQDGDLRGVYARRYTGAGAPLGPEFRVNTYTTGSQATPAVAAGPAGEFVVVWRSSEQDGDNSGVFGQRFDPFGTRVGGEFQVNAYTTGDQTSPAIAVDAAGNFIVAWSGYGLDGSVRAIAAQRYDADGTPQGGEILVNTYTLSLQDAPALAVDPAGNFTVAWHSPQDGSSFGVVARRFSSAGAPLGGEFQVNTYTTGHQFTPAVAYGRSGDFVVVYSSLAGDGDDNAVLGQRFDAAGTPLGAEFVVNAWTTNYQSLPSVTTMEDDGFIVVWRSDLQDGDNSAIVGRRFTSAGVPTGLDVLVNTHTTGAQRDAMVAADPDGDLVVSWASNGQDGSGNGVYAQRFGDLIFQDNLESGAMDLWSAANHDGFDLSVSGAAALAGTGAGLQAFVDDTSALFVQDDTPNAENRYRVRFYLDPNGFDPGESVNKRRVRVFIAFNGSSQRLITLVLRRLTGAYSLMARVRRDDGTRADTAFFPITNAPHVVEFDWRRATSPGANNGSLQLYLDDVLATTVSGIDNDASPVEFARLGVMTVKTAAASGTVKLDQFESRRVNYIGPE